MNPEQPKQKGSLTPLPTETFILHAKCLESKQGRKHLVELLISRKQMQMAAHKPLSSSANHP